ncbi:exonuclease domain-containing protein [Terasakiella sp. A23]|uniref:3'-5' exonuclease n=1 Tax=Terasakiella sp. FCG-A23 TaxID=3080561 RepID=UPI0029550E16|nr:exonuclease domain-containing protein [Terasakiella sp. A23]MDV7341431.1 exonuclease domain-containing protein [Terasakiella sp. A23]
MLKQISKLSLRLRTFLFFLFLGGCVPAIIIPTFYFAHDHILTHNDPATSLFLFGAGCCLALILCVVAIGALFDINVASPIQGLIRDIQTILHGNEDHSVEVVSGKYLDHLPETIRDLASQYRKQRIEVDQAIQKATQETDKERRTLEAILKDLHQGVIICNLNNQVLLYNQRALSLLHVSGDIGLMRSLFRVIDSPPLLHSLRRLRNRLAENRQENHPEGLSTSFVCATCDARYTLEARMTLLLDEDEKTPNSYILTFEDVTEELNALGKRDHLLREATEGLRQPVANLRAAAEMLGNAGDMDADMRDQFQSVLVSESLKLSEKLDGLAADYHGLATGHWPMQDIYSANLLSLVSLRLNDEKDIEAVMTGIPVWLYGDSHSLLLALDQIIHRIHETNQAKTFDLQAVRRDDKIHIDIIWEGAAISSSMIDSWLDIHLTESIGGMSLRDILEHHRCEMWSEVIDDNRARLRLPMIPSTRPIADHTSEDLPARPEFYDFGLLSQPNQIKPEMANCPLSELPFVVFDTETTGLKPSAGDEIIALAGVRILNGRILTGESFARMVNPNRTIPKSSIKFHGITDDMVKDKPPAQIVLPQFHEFSKDAVLVAHNAAFDMKFLHLKEEECGLSFDHPVLDTLLLSVFLHDHTIQHGLNDIAKRFGIEIEGRHTAIGDALVTAGIFQRMIPMLKARGIVTLNDAIEASKTIVEVRAQQAKF